MSELEAKKEKLEELARLIEQQANINEAEMEKSRLEREMRVVDKNDKKLLKLKNEFGEEVYNEVVRAKLEIEGYNASGSYVTLELSNYEENRKATMEEATDVMLKIRKDLAGTKNKRKRPLRHWVVLTSVVGAERFFLLGLLSKWELLSASYQVNCRSED
ncbi:unnamed protein product [Arabis nemorensis]|uniref:Factor of DNA methylation 1-5/IDN2 domain-containing protein n=1 Tax=Arabis nemorensis TaxID=586526 RepID=A0A565CSK2_9BRAS|nr:unnamed protein product [Arabis nemorensis]